MLRGRSFKGDGRFSSSITSLATSFLYDTGRTGAAGCFPRAFALITGRSLTVPLLWLLVGRSCSTLVRVFGGTSRSRAAFRDPPGVPNPASRIKGSATGVVFDGVIFLLAVGGGVSFCEDGTAVVFFFGEAAT